MAQNINSYILMLVLYTISSIQTFEWNNQIQLTRKLNPLRSYKDGQLFRFQIPFETTNAIFSFNASQSNQPINTTIWRNSYYFQPSKNLTRLSKNLNETVVLADDHWTSKLPKWINTTKMTIYTDKVKKFYRSILSNACRKPLNVKFYLRWGSLPLLSLKNATIPENFVFKNQTDQFVIDLKTDGKIVEFNLTNPLPGDWYGIAFINKTNDKILQKGLERECIYQLKSSVSLNGPKMNHVTVLTPSHSISLKQSLIIDQHNTHPELFYKFFTNLQESFGVKIVITNCQFRPSQPITNIRHHQLSNQSPSYQSSMIMNNGDSMQHDSNSSLASSWNMTCPLEINFRSLALPNRTNNDYSFNCHTNQSNVEITNDKCIIDLPTFVPDQWNYVQILSTINIHSNDSIHSNDNNHNHFHRTIFNDQFRTKLMFGTINFTIQVLAGQDAFLYNFFNDQNCQMAASQNNQPLPPQQHQQQQEHQQNSHTTAATTIKSNNNEMPQLHNFNFITKNKDETTIVNDNSKVNYLSSNQLSNHLVNYNVHNELKNVKSSAISTTLSSYDEQIDNLNTGINNDKTSTISIINNNNYDSSIEYNDDFIDVPTDNIKNDNKIIKRSADRSDNRKKQDNKKMNKEERRLKKQKNRNRQRNREKQCQFDPLKIISTLDEDDMINMTTFSIYNLTRYQSFEPFTFRYIPSIFATDNDDISDESNDPKTKNQTFDLNQMNYIEIENDRFTLFNFSIIPQYDIGGNLEIDFAISPWTTHSQQNVTAILCLTHNRLPPLSLSTNGIKFDEHCYGYLISNTSQANFTTMGSSIQSLIIPYPQSGLWFISVLTRCYSNDDDIEDLASLMNMDFSTVSCDYLNRTSIMIDIHSSPCLNSRCLNNGKCQQYLNNGILYSTCTCRAGWKGLICNDGSEALSEQKLLTNFLILTISNTAFIPAILLAAFRHYFTESAIYFITMISSALYHACDSDFSQSYCVFNIGLLQFADFYTAILSFFVTLLTLACLSPGCKSFFHLMGAILIALITQNDHTSLWTFVIPTSLAALLMFCCWCSRCCRKTCYPPIRCWIFSICPAFILTIVGLIIYAFLETQENYPITHSVWHGIVALALFLAISSMPKQNPPDNDNDDDDDENVHFLSSSGSSTGAGGSGKGTSSKNTANTTNNPETYYELIGEEKSHLARTQHPHHQHQHHHHMNISIDAQQQHQQQQTQQITKTY